MIVPMNKLSLLLYHKEKEPFLKSLQDLGVIHVVVNPEIQSEDLSVLQERVKAADRVLKALKRIKKPSISQKTKGSAGDIIKQFDELAAQLEETQQQINKMKKDVATLEPWGDFNPKSLNKLKETGITMRFFKLHEKMFNALKKDDLYYEIINRKEGSVYFVVLERGESALPDVEDIILPQVSLQETLKGIEKLQVQKQKIEKSIEELVAYQDVLKFYLSNQNCHLSLESARINMEEGADGKVLSLTGWLPANKEKKVTEFLNGFSAWFEFNDPVDGEDVPILLINRKRSALFEAITKIFDLPDYFELDPTPFFAPFFALFFGLCLGDLGYGFIVLVLSIVAIKKGSASLKPIFQLGIILGIFTMGAGFLLNTAFGMTIFTVEGSKGVFEFGSGVALLKAEETEKGIYFLAMPFAMYVGLIQIIIGIIIRCYNNLKIKGYRFIFQPISHILLVLCATIPLAKVNFLDMGTFNFGILKIGKLLCTIPYSAILIVCTIGILILFYASTPKIKSIKIKKPFLRFLAFIPYCLLMYLIAIYNFVTSLMSYSLSYLRLFALGLAGGLLGAAFNQLGLMIITKDGVTNWLSPFALFTLLILIFSHALNLGLSALGAFVHSLRLTFVEFYSVVNFKGGGKSYSPLSKFK